MYIRFVYHVKGLLMTQIHSKIISADVNDVCLNGYLARPETPGPGVLLLHAWWGLNDFFKSTASRLAGDGFTVFAPDLMAGKVTRSIEEAKAFQEVTEGSDVEKTRATAAAALAWLREQSLPGRGIGLVGFSMGGYWSLHLAGKYPDAVRAVTLFYGAAPGDFPAMRARIQGHFAAKDTMDPIEWAREVEGDMRAAGLETEFFEYAEAGHWFFESDRPDAYSQPDAELAYQRLVTFLRRELEDAPA